MTPPPAAIESIALPPSQAAGASQVTTLDTVPPHVPYVVHRLVYGTGAGGTGVRELPQRLEELGFLPGERVMVLTRGWPGGDPLAVRVGHSSYALRRAEAACVELRPWPPQ